MTDNTEINGAPAAEETNEQHKNPLEQELAASTVPSFDLAASKDCEEEGEHGNEGTKSLIEDYYLYRFLTP
jgi:hypothetical protein